jgi:transposase
VVAEAGGMLGGFTEVVADLLKEAPAVHFDETGARAAGSLHWVHIACSALYILIECHKPRGTVTWTRWGSCPPWRAWPFTTAGSPIAATTPSTPCAMRITSES